MIPTPNVVKICNIYITILYMIPSPKVLEKVINLVPTSQGLKYAIFTLLTPKEPKCAIYMFSTQKVTE